VDKPFVSIIQMWRWFEANPVDRHPQLFCSLDLGKDLMHAWMLTIVPHGSMVIHLGHPIGAKQCTIPVLRPVRGHAQKIERGLAGSIQMVLCNSVRYHYITIPFFLKNAQSLSDNIDIFSSIYVILIRLIRLSADPVARVIVPLS